VLPAEGWKRPPGRPRIKTVQNNLKCHNLTLTKALDTAQNHSLWRLMTTFGAMQCSGTSQ